MKIIAYYYRSCNEICINNVLIILILKSGYVLIRIIIFATCYVCVQIHIFDTCSYIFCRFTFYSKFPLTDYESYKVGFTPKSV